MPRTRKSKAPPSETTVQTCLPSSTPSTHDPSTTIPPSLPANWPLHLTYLSCPIYSPNLMPSELTILHTPPSNQSFLLTSNRSFPIPASGPYPHISIQTITSPPSHPALKQHGLFATQSLPPGSFVCDYMGYVHPSRPLPSSPYLSTTHAILVADTDVEQDHKTDISALHSPRLDTIPTASGLRMDAAAAASDYDLSLHRELGIGIDASTCGNEARFINDYRGVRPTPNAQFEEHWVRLPPLKRDPLQEHEEWPSEGCERRWKWELQIGVFVVGMRRDGQGVGKKGILAGEEIVVSYGKGFWHERETGGVEGCEDGGMPALEQCKPLEEEERRYDICSGGALATI